MSVVKSFLWNGRVVWAAFVVFLGATVSPARADLIGTVNNTPAGMPVAVLVSLFNANDGTNAPIVLTNNGTTVNLTLPENSAATYGILFDMKVGANYLNVQDITGQAANGTFSYTPTIGGQTYTIAGTLATANPIDTFLPFVEPLQFQGSTQNAREFLFNTTGNATGDVTLSFSVSGPDGLIHFSNTDAPQAPEPASLALAALGLVGLAGYGWRRLAV